MATDEPIGVRAHEISDKETKPLSTRISLGKARMADLANRVGKSGRKSGKGEKRTRLPLADIVRALFHSFEMSSTYWVIRVLCKDG